MLASPLLAPPPTEEQRRSNNKHNLGVVAAVLAVLFLYAYVFTHVGAHVGLPLPQDVVESDGFYVEDVFDSERHVKTGLWMDSGGKSWGEDDEMSVYYLLLVAAFLCVYFLPVRHKRDALSLWTGLIFGVIYGTNSLAFLLLGHLVTYLVLHPDRRKRPWTAALPGLAAAFALQGHGVPFFVLLAVLPPATLILYRYAFRRLVVHRIAGRILRTCVVQSLLITVFAGVVIAGLWGREWGIPVGLLLFFGHWMRLILYHADYKDGLVPPDLSLRGYLANFLCPAVVPRAFWQTVSQGYAYTESVFLSEDKNLIAMGGVKLLLWGLLFTVGGNWFVYRISEGLGNLGIEAYWGHIGLLSEQYVYDGRVSAASVLVTSLLQLTRFTFYMAGIAHFKVGVWRICGFNVAPHFNNWMGSTDFVTLWGRFSFHRREFLLRAFFYPVFFRLSKFRPKLRVSIAIFAAACLGHMIWIRGVEQLFYSGMGTGALRAVWVAWPYDVLQAAAIISCQLFLMGRKRRRRPWTLGKGLIWDVLAAYLTLQLFGLIHIFGYSAPSVSAWDRLKIFLLAFGLRF
ncbi:hypothetical protein ACFL2T_04725 [Elusimicrobiota bacterium]